MSLDLLIIGGKKESDCGFWLSPFTSKISEMMVSALISYPKGPTYEI